jgi:hypothetical protein
MFDIISSLSLSHVTGGQAATRCPCGCGGAPLSHADHLKNGNGGIVPKLPPLSHADQLKAGNGGIVPKL